MNTQKPDAVELLPCPFCGAAARLINGYGNGGSTIECWGYATDCPVGPRVFERAPGVPYDKENPLSSYWLDFNISDAKAIARWNTRDTAERDKYREFVGAMNRVDLDRVTGRWLLGGDFAFIDGEMQTLATGTDPFDAWRKMNAGE